MQVQSATAAGAGFGATAGGKAGKSQSSDFMLMLMAQLKNQNPLEPVQDKDMMAQMAQLNSLETLTDIKKLLESNSGSGQSAYAVSLIGKNITAALDDGTTVQGVVSGASLAGGQVTLQIGAQNVPVSSVLRVSEG